MNNACLERSRKKHRLTNDDLRSFNHSKIVNQCSLPACRSQSGRFDIRYRIKYLLTSILTFCLWNLHGQSTVTYTVDQDFSTAQTLRSKTSVFDIYPLEDGGFFLGGGFFTLFTNPDSPFDAGLAMITSSGSVHPDWDNGGGVSFARELFEHDGGYLFSNTERLIKSTYTGESWYLTFGDTWGDYFKAGEWGIGNNPYEVRWTQDIFILEDQSVLIGGAIATDTLQPSLFRHLMRLLPDGSHDDTFPIVEAMPQGLNTHISKIERASDGSWYVSGRFQGINGHISPHIAHLTADFEVDTEFVSPFYYESISSGLHTEMKLMDSQDRLWFSGVRVRLAENPSDFLHLVRLLPDGTVDPDFQVGRLGSQYPAGWEELPTIVGGIVESEMEEDVFYIYGAFSHYNDTAQPCISVLNNAGYIQENYFLNQGATANDYDPDDPTEKRSPSVRAMEILEDGSILFGGSFSDFMGVERYSMVKLNQGTVGTRDESRLEGKIKLYPNPAKDQITVQVTERSRSHHLESIRISDLSGRTLASSAWGNGRFDVSALASGMYLLQVVESDGNIAATQRLVIE